MEIPCFVFDEFFIGAEEGIPKPKVGAIVATVCCVVEVVEFIVSAER